MLEFSRLANFRINSVQLGLSLFRNSPFPSNNTCGRDLLISKTLYWLNLFISPLRPSGHLPSRGGRLEDLKLKIRNIHPTSGANTTINIVDIGDVIVVDIAVIADTGGINLKFAGRPQPPPRIAIIIYVQSC